MNINSLLKNRVALTPNKEAIVTHDSRLTFLELSQKVDQLANYLSSQGINKSDRVAIYAKNNEFLVVSFLAAMKIGAIGVILNWRLQTSELAYVLQDSDPKFLMYEEFFEKSIEQIKSENVKFKLFSDKDYGLICSQSTGSVKKSSELNVRETDIALILYTSGTTGQPKGACLSHQALIASAQANCFAIEWDYDHRFLLVAPMFHVGGFSPFISNILRGCTTVLVPDFEPFEIWKIIAAEKITSMMSVPIMLQALITVAEKINVDKSSLISVTCGASKVPEVLIRKCIESGINIQQVYGITEFSGAIAYWTKHLGIDTLHSHGKPTFFAELKVVDPDTLEPLPANKDGEIWCQGPMVFSGYWNNATATQAVFKDGWYRTGDIGHFDEEGFLYVVDRLKDMIISGGENIYPAEIEAILSKHPSVLEVAVVGKDDPKWGEIPVAWVVKKNDSELEESELIDYCAKNLAKYKCIKGAYFIDALPRNGSGKILKTQLKA